MFHPAIKINYIRMKIVTTICLFLVLSVWQTQAQTTIIFGSLEQAFSYADQHSTTTKLNQQQTLLNKYQTLAAKGNILNFRNPVNFAMTDNTKLPVNFIPAEAFGGPVGTFRQITLGQTYISNFNFVPQFDIVNIASWARLKSATATAELAEINNKLATKTLHESVAAAYYNSLSFQYQMEVLRTNLATSDTILHIVKDKFEKGIVRSQDVNEATINQLVIKEKINQLNYALQQQLLVIKILCDIPENTEVQLAENTMPSIVFEQNLNATSDLMWQAAKWQHSFALAELKYNRLSHLPVLSFVSSFSWQNNSNNRFFDNSTSWINANYWGLKLSFNLPPDVNKLAQTKTSEITADIARINLAQAKKQNETNNRQMEIAYQQVYSQLSSNQQIYALKHDTYLKSMNQFKENILPLDRLLMVFNDRLTSKLNEQIAQVSVLAAKAKIEINR
jgi:outer membrane protein TolC